MPRLIIHQEDGALRTIELKSGVNRIGRSEENDIPIPNDSVSGLHCELDVKPDGVTIRDLGSTNGTFVDRAPVQEATLKGGQQLRLGQVLCQFVPDAVTTPSSSPLRIHKAPEPEPQAEPEPDAVVPPGPVTHETPVPAAPTDCVNHPGVTAGFICPKCEHKFCPACTKEVLAGMKGFPSCPACGAFCVALEEGVRGAVMEGASFYKLLPGAFSYPFKKNGPTLLICGTIFFGVLEFAQDILSLGFLRLAYFITVIMSSGYLFAFMQNIVISSVHGDEQMPPFPSATDFSEAYLMPAIRLLILFLVLCGPGVLTMIFVHPLAGAAVLLLGLFCFPMTILTVSLADGLGGLNPFVVFSGIAKLPGAYVVTCLVFLLAMAVQGGSRLVLDSLGIPLLPTLLGTFISLYLITVEMRILGLLYFTNEEDLAWFR